MSAVPDTWREDLLAALTFLTRVPLHRVALEAPVATSLARASWAFPLVGAAIGVAGGLAYIVAAGLGLPSFAAALLAVGSTALVTGALHEDGLADTADGFGGGGAREDKLAIMRDSRSGVYGVLALIFSVALRAAALGQIGEAWRVVGALVAAHALARGLLPAAMRFLEPARNDGLGAEAGRPEPNVVVWAGGIGIVAAFLGLGIRPALAATMAAAIAMAALAWLALRQIGGHTGDVLGAIEQGGEIAVLLAAAAWPS